MGKKRTFKYVSTGKIVTYDENDLGEYSIESLAKSGYLGRKEQYKYFCEHPDEVGDQKLFSELREEFGDDNKKET